MKAATYVSAGNLQLLDQPKPVIKNPTDAIVRVLKTTICGTDLHILGGDVPACKEGTILGHEGIGIVEEVGDAVNNFKVGDKVIISCVTACNTCYYCKRSLPSHCEDGGWILGHLINGTQAEYVHIPHADGSLYHAPETVDDEALVMLSDILPTSYEIGVLPISCETRGQCLYRWSWSDWPCGSFDRSILLTSYHYHGGLVRISS